MSASKPEGFHTVTPYLKIRDAGTAIEFYKKAFGATELMRHADPDGKVRHGEFKIGDSPLMISDEFPEHSYMPSVQKAGGSPVSLFLYVDDVDAFATQAQAAGCELIMPVKDESYGRSGGLKDPFGLIWWISTAKG